MMLSEHFSLEEMTHSDTAARLGINNTPDAPTLLNLHFLASRMEIVRKIFGKPIIVTSGYRCEELNRAIGGSPSSAHRLGLACDFRVLVSPNKTMNISDACETLADEARKTKLAFDQIILEWTWTHVGFSPQMRSQILTAKRGLGNRAFYVEGFHA